jgi:hypothetical protein
MFALPLSAGAVEASFLFTLSNFTGPFLIGGGRMFVDKDRNESYIVYQNVVRIFNENGLETYRFNEDNSLGRLSALVVDRDGAIFLLSYNDAGEYQILRCNYRGEPTGKIEVTGLPSDFADYQKFSPNYMVYREGQFYLADARTLRIFSLSLTSRKATGTISRWAASAWTKRATCCSPCRSCSAQACFPLTAR